MGSRWTWTFQGTTGKTKLWKQMVQRPFKYHRTPPSLEQTTNLNHLRSLLYLIVLTDVSVQKPRLMADLSSSWRHCFREVVALDVQLGNFDLEDGPGSLKIFPRNASHIKTKYDLKYMKSHENHVYIYIFLFIYIYIFVDPLPFFQWSLYPTPYKYR